MEQLGLTARQVQRIVENILANSPGFSKGDLLGSDVRIIATREPVFRSLGTVTVPSTGTIEIVRVTPMELGFTDAASAADIFAKAHEYGLRTALSGDDYAAMQKNWNVIDEASIQVGPVRHDVSTCYAFDYDARADAQSPEALYAPESVWFFVRSQK